MSVELLDDSWMRFAGGKRWRCQSPDFLCEIEDPGNTPQFLDKKTTVARLRKVQAYYTGKLQFGQLDSMGTALDIITANSFTESLGSVPSFIETSELRDVYSNASGSDTGAKLDQVVRYVSMKGKYLERREPGYVNPIATPGRVSVGAHHVLISTALRLIGVSKHAPSAEKERSIIDLVCRLPADGIYAAELAVKYFNESHGKHLNQPPLLAATYNAGSPRQTDANDWHLVQYGEHVTRWVSYFNTSRLLRHK